MGKRYAYNAFISYSRKDAGFARKLEKALEKYKPPKDLDLPQENLKIFRDEKDMAGTEYFMAISEHLKNSSKLIVICSPNSRNSKLVNDEIQRFCELNESYNIISILLDGIPNNAANQGQENQIAFPDALCEALKMPLAINYLGFRPSIDKLHKGNFESSWHTLLANIYDVSRKVIEQRERKRQTRKKILKTSIVSMLFIALFVIFYGWQLQNLKIANEKAKSSEALTKAAQDSIARLNAEKRSTQALAKANQDSLARLNAEKDKDLAIERQIIEEQQRQLENSLRLTAEAYKVIYREPTKAVMKAYDANVAKPTSETNDALRDAYKVAMYHYENRRETSKMTGSGPSYAAAKWKQTPLFTEFSPDGRYQLIVTDRGEDGANPPGDVFLLNNETLKLTKLVSCGHINRRVEDVGFSNNCDLIFITRYFELGIYSLTGKCIGEYSLSGYTKSPVHIVEGILWNKYLVCGETKGGLYLVNFENLGKDDIQLQNEWHGDAALHVAISSNGRYGAVVFESGRISLINKTDKDKAQMQDIVKSGGLYAGFNPLHENQFVISGENGLLQIWQISEEIKKIKDYKIGDFSLDWISFDEDDKRLVAVSSNHTLVIVDSKNGQKICTLNYSNEMDWSDPKTVAVNPEDFSVSILNSTDQLSFSDTSLKISKLIERDNSLWLVGEFKRDSNSQFGLFKAKKDSLLYYPCNLPIGGLTSSISITNPSDNLIWFEQTPILNLCEGGPLFRYENDRLEQLPKVGIDVRTVIQQGKILWLGTNKGLFELKDNLVFRRTNDDLEIIVCKMINNQLWLGTNHGAYVLEKDRLIRLTDRSIIVRDILELSKKIWILSGTSGIFGTLGPAYYISGYFAIPVPHSKAKVKSISEYNGQTYLETQKGTYIYTNSKALLLNESEKPQLKPIAIKTIEIAEDKWIFYKNVHYVNEYPYNVGCVAKLFGKDTLKVDIGNISVNDIQLIAGEIWLLTDSGAFRIVNNKSTRTPNLEVSVKSIASIYNEVWLLLEKGVIKWNSGAYTFYSTGDKTPRTLKVVGDQIWLLTMSSYFLQEYNWGSSDSIATTNGIAFRIKNEKLITYQHDSVNIDDVFYWNNQFWFLTEKESKPGPIINVDRFKVEIE